MNIGRNTGKSRFCQQKIVHKVSDSVLVVFTKCENTGIESSSRLLSIYPNRCISAQGKSNVYHMIREAQEKQILAIVDGAAFGSEMGKIYRYLLSSRIDCVIYAPESFEFLLLSAGFIDVSNEILEETYMYADSSKYLSWEAFYTHYLSEVTRDTVFQYNKSRLAAAYKTSGALSRVLALMPDKIKLKTTHNDSTD